MQKEINLMKIFIGNDHAAAAEKLEVLAHLQAKGHELEDCGIAIGEKADYPDIAQIVSNKVLANI